MRKKADHAHFNDQLIIYIKFRCHKFFGLVFITYRVLREELCNMGLNKYFTKIGSFRVICSRIILLSYGGYKEHFLKCYTDSNEIPFMVRRMYELIQMFYEQSESYQF